MHNNIWYILSMSLVWVSVLISFLLASSLRTYEFAKNGKWKKGRGSNKKNKRRAASKEMVSRMPGERYGCDRVKVSWIMHGM